MKIGFFKVIGLIGTLAEELTKAAADNRVTIHEALIIISRICETLGIDFDKEGFDLLILRGEHYEKLQSDR